MVLPVGSDALVAPIDENVPFSSIQGFIANSKMSVFMMSVQ